MKLFMRRARNFYQCYYLMVRKPFLSVHFEYRQPNIPLTIFLIIYNITAFQHLYLSIIRNGNIFPE